MIDIINQVTTWVTVHWVEIVAVYAGLVTISSYIVRWTPTLKDDTIRLKIIKFLGKYIAVNRNINDDEIRSQ